MKTGAWLLLALIPLLGACAKIETRIEIQASPDRVWEKFADFESYKEWNPFIRSLKAREGVAPGREIEVRISPPGGDPMTFRPNILEIKKGRALEWEGQLIMPGIFTGRHRFELIKLGPKRTLFLHTEKFSGILIPFFNFEYTRRGFQAMNRKLKERAEN